VAHGRECALDGVRRAQMLPVLCWEVVEGEQSFAIFGQAFDRLLIFDGVDFDERVECDESILLGGSGGPKARLACLRRPATGAPL
jgi:hypothetical protein